MSNGERRKHPRQPLQVEAELILEGATLQGRTLNVSKRGVLLRTPVQLFARVRIEGKEYRARVLRVLQRDSGERDYALELKDDLEV